jgi:hypothetical protein
VPVKRGARRDPFDVPRAPRKAARIPFDFVLELLEPVGPRTRPMFGCTAVYVEDKIVFILRDKPAPAADNGVWIATTPDHHASLAADLPSMRSITVFGPGVTGWQNLPSDAIDFEESVERACRMVERGDLRIGKIPGAKSAKKKAGAAREPTKKKRR